MLPRNAKVCVNQGFFLILMLVDEKLERILINYRNVHPNYYLISAECHIKRDTSGTNYTK